MAKSTNSLFSNSQQSVNSGSGNSWLNPANVGQVAGAATTTVSSDKNESFSDTLRVTGFSDSEILAGSSILGIEVEIVRSANVANECFDDNVVINAGGSTSTNKAKATAWPTSSAVEVYGGQTDLWGLSGVTGADLAALEIDIGVTSDNATDVTASITEVRATFYYLPVGLGDEVGWWCPSLDDTGDGTATVNDLSGSGDDGALTNMDAVTDWVSDTDSGGVRALDFDGSDDHVVTTAALPSTATLSVSLWVKTADPQLDTLASWDLSGSNRSFHVRKKATGEAEVFSSPDGTTTAYHRFETTTLIDDNAWHHVVATFDNGTIQIWIDGINQSLTDTGVGSPAGSIHDNASSLQIAATNGTQNPITARIDDARIFARSLSADEIEHLASARGVLGSAGGSVVAFLLQQIRFGVVES